MVTAAAAAILAWSGTADSTPRYYKGRAGGVGGLPVSCERGRRRCGWVYTVIESAAQLHARDVLEGFSARRTSPVPIRAIPVDL